MRILVADDDLVSRKLLEGALRRFGHDPVAVADGNHAWDILIGDDAPHFALLDWSMPGLSGPDICRRLRDVDLPWYPYVILVTAKHSRGDLVAGLDAGANDFIPKPFDPDELLARIRVGERLLAQDEEIRRSRAYLQSVLSNIDSGVLLMDSLRRIVFANAAIATLSGQSPLQLVGKGRDDFVLRELIQGSDDPTLFERLRAYDATNAEEAIEFELKRPSRRILRWSTKEIHLPEGSGKLDIYRDVTRQAELTRMLTEYALTDPLTGVFNRRGGEDAIGREIARRVRHGGQLTFALVDIDHFKKVNDTHGHAVGDKVIALIAQRVREHLRQADILIRWGGEEFLIVLIEAGLHEAHQVVDRCRQDIAQFRSDDVPPVTFSAGIAELGQEEVSTAIARADQHLYDAKSAGRNQVRSI